jgi:hypothetical protein
MIERRSPKRT